MVLVVCLEGCVLFLVSMCDECWCVCGLRCVL